MPFKYQIDAKPYTVWNLTPRGWTIIKPFLVDKYTFKTIQTIELKDNEKTVIKFDSVKNEIMK